MLTDCIQHETSPQQRLIWAVIIALGHVIGGLAYFFLRRPRRRLGREVATGSRSRPTWAPIAPRPSWNNRSRVSGAQAVRPGCRGGERWCDSVGVIRGVSVAVLVLVAGSFGVAEPLEERGAGGRDGGGRLRHGGGRAATRRHPAALGPHAAGAPIEATQQRVAGTLVTPFDWLRLRSEHAPRGPVELVGMRERHRAALARRGRESGTPRCGPPSPPELAERHRQARALAATGQPAEAASAWVRLWLGTSADPPLIRAWLELQAGNGLDRFAELARVPGVVRPRPRRRQRRCLGENRHPARRGPDGGAPERPRARRCRLRRSRDRPRGGLR